MAVAALAADVLIVGAGPTGSTLALLLARGGIDVVLVDREADYYRLPRAAHLDHEALRIFQAIGLADPIVASSRQAPRYDFVTADRRVLMRFDRLDGTAPGGWPASNMIHQPSIEALLRAAIADSGAIRLRTGWTLTALASGEAGADATFLTGDGQTTIAARYVVGADGARSAVRELSGIACHDLRFDEPWLVVDAIVLDPSRLPTVNLQICDPERPTTCVLMGSGRHRWEFMLKPGETAAEMLEDARIATLLAPWDVEGAIAIERTAVYRFNALLAEHWRQGRVLLAGDAAHQMPPFAGQGLCSGLRDAANLAWKLAAIVAGGASDSLLDAYQPEREPNVRGIVDMAMMMGRMVCTLDPAAAAARDAQLTAAFDPAAPAAGGPGYPAIAAGCIAVGTPAAGCYFPQPLDPADRANRFDDVAGPDAWLIGRTGPPGSAERDGMPGLRTLALDDPRLTPFAAQLRRWLDDHAADAVLVRPDRYVFGAGDAASLRCAWRAALAGPKV